MGQPAISQSTYYLVVGSVESQNIPCDGAGHTTFEDYDPLGLVHNHELRSANSNNPKSSSGWRNPSGFIHLGRTIRQCTNSTAVTVRTRTPAFFTPCGLDGHDSYDIKNYRGNQASDYAMSVCPAAPAYLQDKAEIEALMQLQDQKVNLSTNFAERRQTADLMRNACAEIANDVKSFRRRRPQDFAFAKRYQGLPAYAKRIPKRWLELQYGWKPLMSDIHGVADLIIKRSQDGKADRVRVHGHATDSQTSFWDKGAPNGRFLFEDRAKWKVNVSLNFRMMNPVVASLSSLGITNPAYLLWEELPYSFVVDWFSPVGNWLNSLTADFGWEFLGGTHTLKQEFQTRNIGYKPIRDPLGLVSSTGFAEGQGQEWNDYWCYTYDHSPVPGLYLKNPLSAMHVSEAFSLLATAFR